MTEAIDRLVQLLEADVVVTLGEQYRRVVRQRALGLDRYEGAAYDEKLVDDVQQEFHDRLVDTTWPVCPRHGRHPLWYHDDGWWWCEQDRVALCKLGDLGTLLPRVERRP
jgi:hypothetical protein